MSAPGDRHEIEADHAADTVLQMPNPGRRGNPGESPSHLQAGSGGEPLSPDLQAYFESRFGHGLGAVRLHTDAEAGRRARAIDASAFTQGSNIFFAPGRHDTGSTAGRRLLAHELAHVVQERNGTAPPGTINRQVAGSPLTIVRIDIFPESREVLVTLSDTTVQRYTLTSTDLPRGTYTGDHEQGHRYDSHNGPFEGWRAAPDTTPTPQLEFSAIGTTLSYPLVVHGREGDAPQEATPKGIEQEVSDGPPPPSVPPTSTAEEAETGIRLQLPTSLKDDWPAIVAAMKEVLPPSDPTAGPAPEGATALSEREALLFLKIAKSPVRAAIVERARSSGAAQRSRPATLADTLESAIAEVELADARRRLGLGTPGHGGETPIVDRPVRGDVVLTGGRPVPKKEAVFTFRTKDEVDAFRAPWIQIQWVAYPEGHPDKPVDSELNTYSPLRSDGPINDKTFEVAFEDAGTYVIEALVHHNFYRSATFRTAVKVLTEDQETDHQEKTALAGLVGSGPTTTERKDFDVGGLSEIVSAFDEGSVTKGPLTPDFRPPTLAERLKVADDEIIRIEKLVQQYKNSKEGTQGAAIKKWAETYLATLQAGRDRVAAAARDKVVVPCGGVYVSRSGKAGSKALDLVCLLELTGGGYAVELHDISQVYETENYRFRAAGQNAEQAFEKVFLEQAKAYPDGTLSVAFRGWDDVALVPKNSYVKFRLVTDTVGGKIKEKVFAPALNIGVNLAAAALMVVPGMQAAGFALAIIWNTSQSVIELEEKHAKGTLKGSDIRHAGVQLALDLLPVVGRAAPIVRLGNKAYYVLEGVEFLGQAVLITPQAIQQVAQIRNGVIARLADVNAQLAEIERLNPADPRIDALKREQADLIAKAQHAWIEVSASIAREQAMMAVGSKVVEGATARIFRGSVREMESSGLFTHRRGAPVHYDHAKGKIVGDRSVMTVEALEAAQRTAWLAEALGRHVPDPTTRRTIIDALGVGGEVVTGSGSTRLEIDGPKKILHIAPDARPDDIAAHATGIGTPPAEPGARGATTGSTGRTGTAGPTQTAQSVQTTQPTHAPETTQTTEPTGTPGGSTPGAGFGLDRARTEKLLAAVTPEQATVLHEFLGEAGLRSVVQTRPGRLRTIAEGLHAARSAALADTRAAAGLARMGTKPQGAGHAMSPQTVAEVLAQVPSGRMELFLRVLGDAAMPHPATSRLGRDRLVRLARSVDELGFVSEFGGGAYGALRGEKAFRPLLDNLRGLEPEQAHALVDAVRSAKTKAAKLRAAGVEPPVRTPRRASGRVAPRTSLPGWKEHLDRAKKFAEDHRGQPDRRGRPFTPTDEQIEMLATLYQVREQARSSRGLPHDRRVQILDEFDQLGREAGLQTPWINNLRGDLSEALFSPNSGRGKTRLPYPGGGVAILDYAFEAGERPGSKTGQKEWVEQKSDLITAPGGSMEAFGPAVGRARRYAGDAALDAKALGPGETILIDFVRRPGNVATEQAMLAELFAPGSPIKAVRFADGPWIERGTYPAGGAVMP